MTAFNGADGFGKQIDIWGASGLVIRTVTNLNDSGAGSFREAVNYTPPCVVVFEVAGTIALGSDIGLKSNTYIAGQTAPGEGITYRNYRISALDRTKIIIRYIRGRLGNTASQVKAPIFMGRVDGVIVDHCSFSFAIDETLTISKCANVSIQNCIISESLNRSIHPEDTGNGHGMGVFIGGKNYSFHNNLIMHHKERFPMFQGKEQYKSDAEIAAWHGIIDYRNNIHYNCANRFGNGGSESTANLINNLYIPGPAKPSQSKFFQVQKQTGFDYGRYYISGNEVEGVPGVLTDQKTGIVFNTPGEYAPNINTVIVNTPFAANVYDVTKTVAQAYADVVANAGCSLVRDAIDIRLIDELEGRIFTHTGSNGSTGGVIDSQADVGGWPTLATSPARETFADYLIAESLPGGTFQGDTAPSGRFYYEEYLDWLAIATLPDPPVTPWTITTLITGSGTVAKSPDNPTYVEGASVTLTANPLNSFWQFSKWVDQNGNENTSNPRVFTVPESNTTLTAQFTLIEVPTGKKFRAKRQTFIG